MISNLSVEDGKDVYMVIFMADFDETLKYAALTELSNGFKKHVDQGLLHLIFAPRGFYPPLSNMKTKFGDSQQRIAWRSKLVIDFAFLMYYCKDLSRYYLHLEDDLVPTPSLYPKLKNFITSQKKPWLILDAALMGHTAKIYHSSDLENVATYLHLMYNEMPVDRLVSTWRRIKSDGNFMSPPASFFQHIGDNSSFIENKDSFKSKETFFDEYDHKYKGLNPPATINSSMHNSYDGAKPEYAYNKGSGYFWVREVKKGDFIVIEFSSVTTVRAVFVDTGSNFAPTDQLKSGVLQASFQGDGNETQVNDSSNCRHFETIGDFKNGRVKVSLHENRKLFCLRILVRRDQAEWLFVREIDVWHTHE